ncbi:hypothetical protein ORD22_06325 [Sporosarcina sp. GW1-11]|nr:hypothetical protein [Sporosarcina sp. GW1-11]MDV6377877.1 hypothetical protein [Sporosarcina sp. GW1-11]
MSQKMMGELVLADDLSAPFASDGNTSALSFLIGGTIVDQLLIRRKR